MDPVLDVRVREPIMDPVLDVPSLTEHWFRAMVGLRTVKEQALCVYESVLGDQLLKKQGFAKAALSPTLNFVFMGSSLSVIYG